MDINAATFNELGAAMMQILESRREQAGQSAEGRDLALSITHLEDSLMRYNSSRYHALGTWQRNDPDA